jgi:monoamine oxidase
MASSAKALVPFPSAFWRAQGNSGSALAPHPGAVLGEVFDASDARGQPALGGFFALGPRERHAKAHQLPELVLRQLAELFGPLPPAVVEPRIQDWATERFTTSVLDLERPALAPTGAAAIVGEPLWNERLFIAGTETAPHHPGHMEGALEAALRVASLLGSAIETSPPRLAAPFAPSSAAWLQRFGVSVHARRAHAGSVYVDGITRALSGQDSADATQRALLEAAASAYRGALKDLASAPFLDGALDPAMAIEHVEAILAPFAGFSQELIGLALRSNQTSCAMRAFPDEARPSDEYLLVIRSDLRNIHEEFERQVRLHIRMAERHGA